MNIIIIIITLFNGKWNGSAAIHNGSSSGIGNGGAIHNDGKRWSSDNGSDIAIYNCCKRWISGSDSATRNVRSSGHISAIRNGSSSGSGSGGAIFNDKRRSNWSIICNDKSMSERSNSGSGNVICNGKSWSGGSDNAICNGC